MFFQRNGPDLLTPLSQEIMQHIATFLGAADLGNLRTMNRRIEQNVFKHLSENFFGVLHTDLSRKSLDTLLKVSGVERIAANVNELHVESHALSFGDGFEWGHLLNHTDTTYLVQPCIPLLSEIMLKLINCRTFKVNNLCLASEHSFDETPSPPDACGAIRTLLDIICRHEIPVKGFDLTFGGCASFLRCSKAELRQNAWNVPPIIFQGFKKAWSTVETLTLKGTIIPSMVTQNLSLVHNATNLRKLVIDFTPHESELAIDAGASFMEMMTLLQGTEGAIPPVEDLTIIGGWTHHTDMLEFLSLFGSTLRTLKLERCTSRNIFGEWTDVFDGLVTGNCLPHLESISVRDLDLPSTMEWQMKIYFEDLHIRPVIPDTGGCRWKTIPKVSTILGDITGAEYSGPHMNQALLLLAVTCQVVFIGWSSGGI